MAQRRDVCYKLLADDPVLIRFRAALADTYGDRLQRAVLFGSRAGGDFQPDSDDDIAVFIRGPDAWFDEVARLANIGADILVDTGAVISAKPRGRQLSTARSAAGKGSVCDKPHSAFSCR